MWYTKGDANANDYRLPAVSGAQHGFCRESSTAGGKMISRESGIFGTGTGKKTRGRAARNDRKKQPALLRSGCAGAGGF